MNVSKISIKILMCDILACPMFKEAMSKGFGILCHVHDDCLGITCNVPFTLGSQKETAKTSFQLMADLSIKMVVNGRTVTIVPNGS